MQVIYKINKLRERLWEYRLDGASIAFVPTMGNLHEGHLRLLDTARQHADVVVASIFVNPLQFGPQEDFDGYPRSFVADQEKLTARACHLLFAPSTDEMYPQTKVSATKVDVPHLSDIHCGLSRPLFFSGVATVVSKLFGIVQPDYAVFGLKDFQQYLVIKQLTEDLCLPVEIIGAPIARAENGVALSSRNGYLSNQELATAAYLYQILQQVSDKIQQGQRDYTQLQEWAQQQLESVGFRRDYLHVCRQSDLQLAGPEDRTLVVLAAAHLGKARLIDNIQLQI